jgi:hypothetical protein
MDHRHALTVAGTRAGKRLADRAESPALPGLGDRSRPEGGLPRSAGRSRKDFGKFVVLDLFTRGGIPEGSFLAQGDNTRREL